MNAINGQKFIKKFKSEELVDLSNFREERYPIILQKVLNRIFRFYAELQSFFYELNTFIEARGSAISP